MRKYLALLAFGLCSTSLHAQTTKDGIDAWQRGDNAAAVAIWKPIAEKGDADAAFNLGQAYRLGKGVPLDLAQAQGWFEKAARKGHVDAQTTLGLLLFQGGNQVSAMRWLTAAAEAGEPRALLMVGTALYNGDGVAPDPVKAYAYVSRAAAQGLPPAKATLADLDQVIPLDQRKAGVALAQKMAAGSKPAPAPVKIAAKHAAPTPKPAAQPPHNAAPPKVAASKAAEAGHAAGSWRVQLGAFSQRSSAEGLYAKLQGKLDGRQAYYVAVGKVIRLQAGPYDSKASAATACGRVAPSPCFPVDAR